MHKYQAVQELQSNDDLYFVACNRKNIATLDFAQCQCVRTWFWWCQSFVGIEEPYALVKEWSKN